MAHISEKDNSDSTKKRFERTAAAFNAIYDDKSEFSGWFNKTFRKPIFERYDITFESMGDLKNQSVLDVGCGSGVYAVQCARDGASLVKGIDFSDPMLQIAKNRAQTHQVAHICQFQDIDFLYLDVKDQYNFSIAMGVFDYLTDPLTFLRKLKKVTKNRIIASFPGHSLIRAPLRKIRYLLTSKTHVYFYSRQDIQKLIDEVKFRQTEIRPLKTGSGFILIADI